VSWQVALADTRIILPALLLFAAACGACRHIRQTVVLLGKFAPHPLDTAAESLKKEALTQARTRAS
jgi:hypothetical protein